MDSIKLLFPAKFVQKLEQPEIFFDLLIEKLDLNNGVPNYLDILDSIYPADSDGIGEDFAEIKNLADFKTIKKLVLNTQFENQKRGIHAPRQIKKFLAKNVEKFSFEQLTSVDRMPTNDCLTVEDGATRATKIRSMLKEARSGFEQIVGNDKGVYMGNLHPRIILSELLQKSDHDSRRILIKNLDKMKMALPFVYPKRNCSIYYTLYRSNPIRKMICFLQ